VLPHRFTKGFRVFDSEPFFFYIHLKAQGALQKSLQTGYKLKINFIYLSLILFTSASSAQSRYEDIANKFIVFYNNQTPDSLFNLYASELKEKLTLEKTKTILEGLHVQYGDLRSLDLIKQDSGFNGYKASFAHQTLILLLALSDENLIEGYRLVPYKPDPTVEQNQIKR